MYVFVLFDASHDIYYWCIRSREGITSCDAIPAPTFAPMIAPAHTDQQQQESETAPSALMMMTAQTPQSNVGQIFNMMRSLTARINRNEEIIATQLQHSAPFSMTPERMSLMKQQHLKAQLQHQQLMQQQELQHRTYWLQSYWKCLRKMIALTLHYKGPQVWPLASTPFMCDTEIT